MYELSAKSTANISMFNKVTYITNQTERIDANSTEHPLFPECKVEWIF